MPGINPQPGDVCQARTVAFIPGQISENVTHWLVASMTGTGSSVTAAAQRLDTLVASLYQNIMPATAAWRGVGFTNLANPRSVEGIGIGHAGPGVVAGNGLPSQVSFLISWRTALAGRANRGRIYPGLLAASFQNADGTMSAGALVSLSALAAGYGVGFVVGAGVNTTTYQLVVRHPDTFVGPVQTQHYSTVTQALASSVFATQRRRGQLGRPNILPI